MEVTQMAKFTLLQTQKLSISQCAFTRLKEKHMCNDSTNRVRSYSQRDTLFLKLPFSKCMT